MTLYILPLVLAAVLITLVAVIVAAMWRALRRAFLLEAAEFAVTPQTVKPGEGLRVWARVVPRGNRALVVRAALTCTMFDHRDRRLYDNSVVLTPIVGRPHELAAYIQMPSYALRTGVVGAELSNLFSEDAHRLLVFWSMDFDVRLAGGSSKPIVRASIPLDVPEGKKLEPDRAYVERLIVETCAAMHSDLVFNWLVRIAAIDGVIAPEERDLLHWILRVAHHVEDPAAADARIAAEMHRDLSIDPLVLRKNLPSETLAAFYRFLYAMAWRDGWLDGREHGFLVDVLEAFGLDEARVAEIEREVLYGVARPVHA